MYRLLNTQLGRKKIHARITTESKFYITSLKMRLGLTENAYNEFLIGKSFITKYLCEAIIQIMLITRIPAKHEI